MTPGKNGKSPYRYKNVESFIKAHPDKKGKTEKETSTNWYNWEVEKFIKGKK